MLVTEFPIVTDVNPVQLLKAWLPICVTEFGIVTDVNPMQPEKARFPMLVTLYTP